MEELLEKIEQEFNIIKQQLNTNPYLSTNPLFLNINREMDDLFYKIRVILEEYFNNDLYCPSSFDSRNGSNSELDMKRREYLTRLQTMSSTIKFVMFADKACKNQ